MAKNFCFRCGQELGQRNAPHLCQRAYQISLYGGGEAIIKRAPTFGALCGQMKEAGFGEDYRDWRLVSEGPVF